MAERRLSMAEILRRRKLAIESGDATGGPDVDRMNPSGRRHADAVREQLGIKKRRKPSGSR